MATRVVLAFDVGTSGVKAALVDAERGIVASAGRRYGRVAGPMTVTDDVAARLLRLPMHYDLTRDQVAGIVEDIAAFFG